MKLYVVLRLKSGDSAGEQLRYEPSAFKLKLVSILHGGASHPLNK